VPQCTTLDTCHPSCYDYDFLGFDAFMSAALSTTTRLFNSFIHGTTAQCSFALHQTSCHTQQNSADLLIWITNTAFSTSHVLLERRRLRSSHKFPSAMFEYQFPRMVSFFFAKYPWRLICLPLFGDSSSLSIARLGVMDGA
jgi:hypothetical protein